MDIWNIFDVDGNGTMSEEEFLLYIGVNEYGSLKQRLLCAYLLADKNGDGRLTKKEINVVFSRMMRIKKRAEVPGPHAKKMAAKLIPADKERIAAALERFMAVADHDNSGVVSLDEFLGTADKHPELFDLFNVVV